MLLIVRGVLARRANATAAMAGNATPYWPAQAWRSAVACLVVLSVILLLACQHGIAPPEAGVPLLSPADTDPASSYDAARPEWFLVGVYEFSHLFSGQWAIIPIFIVPGLLVVIVLAMPFLAQRAVGQAFNVVFTIVVLVGLVGMSYYSLAKDRANEAHQKAIALEKQQARRVCELARHEGIPPTGALACCQRSQDARPAVVHPKLCQLPPALCRRRRRFAGRHQSGQANGAELQMFATRAWIAGLLNPKEIVSPRYFGNTKLRASKMVNFVKETLGELDPGEKKKLQKVVMAISAEAKLPSQSDLDKKDAKAIEEGRKLIVDDFGCTDCHKFHAKGKLGDAPELTGYGSPEWIGGIVRNPADKRFYGKLTTGCRPTQPPPIRPKTR